MRVRGLALRLWPVAVVLAAACSRDGTAAGRTAGGSASASPAAAAVPAPPRDVCAMITAQELQAATSLRGQGQPSRSGSADVCTWLAGEAAAIVQVHGSAVEFDTARAAFQELYGGMVLDVAGIGERAFYIEGKTSNIATSTLTAQRGATPVTVQILGGADSTRRRHVEALARLAVGKL